MKKDINDMVHTGMIGLGLFAVIWSTAALNDGTDHTTSSTIGLLSGILLVAMGATRREPDVMTVQFPAPDAFDKKLRVAQLFKQNEINEQQAAALLWAAEPGMPDADVWQLLGKVDKARPDPEAGLPTEKELLDQVRDGSLLATDAKAVLRRKGLTEAMAHGVLEDVVVRKPEESTP